MFSPNLARRAVAAARTFQAKEYWQRFCDADVLAFELPDEPQLVYATILGAGGEHFGISLFRGERALDQLREITTNAHPTFIGTMLVLSFDPPGSVPPERRSVAAAAGISDRIIPVIFTVDPGMRTRDPRNAELRCFITVLDAIELADARGLLKPRRFQAHRACKMLTFRVTGGGHELDVAARYQEVPGPSSATAIVLPWPMPELPLIDAHWVIGLEPAPMAIEGEAGLPCFLLAADADDGHLHDMRVVVVADDDLEDIAQELADVFASPREGGEGGVPRRLTFVHKRLHDALAAPLTEFGVTVDLVDNHPFIKQAVRAFSERKAARDPEHVPAADDTEGWRGALASLWRRVEDHKDAVGLESRKALATFFGDAEALTRLAATRAQLPRSAFRQWFLVAYRGKNARRTLAERLLDEPLPTPERLLLQANVAARVGIYRVTRVQAPLVVLSDILSDYQVREGRTARQLLGDLLGNGQFREWHDRARRARKRDGHDPVRWPEPRTDPQVREEPVGLPARPPQGQHQPADHQRRHRRVDRRIAAARRPRTARGSPPTPGLLGSEPAGQHLPPPARR